MVNRSMLIRDMMPYTLYTKLSDNRFQEYRGIYLLDGSDAPELDIVYVGSCEEAARMLIGGKIAEGGILFAAGDSERLKNAPDRNVTLVVTELPLASLYNHLSRIFLQNDEWKRMVETNANKDIRHLLNAISRQTGISVLLMNPEYQPMVRCVQADEQGLFPSNPMEPGTKSCEAIQYMLQELEQCGYDMTVTTERVNGYVFALIPVWKKGRLRGYLYGCSNGRKSTLRNLLYELSQACYELLENEELSSPDRDSFQALAVQFLSEHPGDMEKLEMRLRHLKNPPKKFKRSIVIRFIDEDGKMPPIYPQNMRRLFQELYRFFPKDNMALLNESIYIMISEEQPHTPVKIAELEKLEALLSQHHAFAMLSNASYNLKGVRVLATQCYQTLPIAVSVRINEEMQRHCLTFERYAPYYIIHLCYKAAKTEMGTDDILYLCHPAINILTRYDRANNSNLRDTMFSYLMNDRSIARTSQKMFIHRNTTIYKLNKIQELISDDLENPYTRHQLILSCMIIRYIEEYHHGSFHLPPLYGSKGI